MTMFYTLDQAAAKTGVAGISIRRYIKQGVVKSIRVGKQLAVSERALATIVKARDENLKQRASRGAIARRDRARENATLAAEAQPQKVDYVFPADGIAQRLQAIEETLANLTIQIVNLTKVNGGHQ